MLRLLNSSAFTLGNECISILTSLLNVFMQKNRILNGKFHHICYCFSIEMFISSLPTLWLGSSLLRTKQHRADYGPCESRRTKSSRERKERGREKKACLVQKPFNNFPWKLKEEIVLGWIAVGGNEAHMRTR